MGDFSYSNDGQNYNQSFFKQMYAFMRQIATEGKIDCYDLRTPRDDDSHTEKCRDILLVHESRPLLSVYLSTNSSGFNGYRETKIEAEGLGARLSKALEEANPTQPAIHRYLSRLMWKIIFRGKDTVETVFEGDQFDLEEINRAFNAIETRLIAEVKGSAV